MLLLICNMKKQEFTKLKFLADLNISPKTVTFLTELGTDAVRIDKSNAADSEVVAMAKKEGRIILTFDKDFGEIYYLFEKRKITVIVLYLRDQRYENANRILKNFLSKIDERFIQTKLILLYEDCYRIIQ